MHREGEAIVGDEAMTGLHTVGRLDAPRRIRMDRTAIPEAGPADVLVRVASTGICGTDLAFFREGAPLPGAILGHEFSGTVVAAGADVRGIAVGDRVVANPMIDLVGLGRLPGSFAEYLRVPAAEAGRNLFALPAAISDEAGALVEPFAVALHAVNRARAGAGDKVAIYGAGPIGLCVLAALRARGVTRVVAIEPSARRRAIALAMGAAAVHDPVSGSSRAFVGRLFGEEATPYDDAPLAQADVAFDCAGVAAALDDAVHSLARRGRLVLVADPHHAALTALRLVMLRELEVLGALAYDDEFDAAIALLAEGTVDLSPLVTHRFALADLAQAFAAQMDAETAVKVLVAPG
jgi:2-desacetyl-2-hydroxyethyl bacteriochlorophyllide A dehydrogenase